MRRRRISDMLTQFSILDLQSIPFVLHIPHSGKCIPDDVRKHILLNDDQLSHELLAMTDAFTDDLFSMGVSVGGTAMVNNLSRLVVDPERFPNDEDEVMSTRGMGAVYLRTSDMGFLRNPDMYNSERTRLIEKYFNPYNEAMTKLVATRMTQFGRCLILDCHSFPSKPLKYELDQEMSRPEICFGTDDFLTPAKIVDSLVSICRIHGLKYELNKPYAGTYVPMLYSGGDKRMSSVMIEVRRDIYMDELTGDRKPSFTEIKGVIDKMIQILAEYAKSIKPVIFQVN